MDKIKRKIGALAGVIFFVVGAIASAKKLDAPGLYHYTLDNGLHVFIMENNAAPLAFIMLTARTGAVSQTPENIGLFHLYEHMMFKGNAKYPDQAASKAAMDAMGVENENAYTSVDSVSYFFTVPAAKVYDGLEFWSYAMRTPLIDDEEFAVEKEVVVSEITANMADPSRIAFMARCKHLFPDSPWRTDVSGTVEMVRNATAEQLRAIQGTFYVPNNAAIFVGGDVRHKEIYKMVKAIYGDWKRTDSVPFEEPPSKTPLDNVQKFVYANPRLGDNFVQVSYALRGPDAETDAADTYGADMWSYLMDRPDSAFKTLLKDDSQLSVFDTDYIGGGCSLSRASGMVSLYSILNNDGDITQKTDHWLSVVRNQGVTVMKSDDFLHEKLIATAKTQMENEAYYEQETAEGFLRNLSYMWAASGLDYFLQYEKHMKSVSAKDVRSFVEKYIEDKNGMFIVYVSPSVYEKNREAFAAGGYAEINEDNAFWWKE